jgi:GH15 family glucan-1,4-alpha-glucosidase
MAQKYSLPAPAARWQEVRNEIHHSLYEDFWDETRSAFVQAKGSQALDAACLLMPLVKFVSPTDPRWLSTLDAVGKHLADDALVRRYDGAVSAKIDGLDGEEGSFTICSFWYVECLARAGRVDEARLLFDKLLSYANPLGLYAEQLGPAGDHLGNFPQAFTHLALISAAHAVDRAIADR